MRRERLLIESNESMIKRRMTYMVDIPLVVHGMIHLMPMDGRDEEEMMEPERVWDPIVSEYRNSL